MATNADGSYKLEDDGVAQRVAAITSGNSDLMKVARTQGTQTANRRGLGNSSMAVGAAEMAALNAAVPIASQEASQVAQRNVTGMGLAAEDARLTRTIGAEDSRLTRTLDADMARTRLGLDAEAARQATQIGAEDARLGRTIDADMARQQAAQAAELERLGITVGAEDARLRAQLAADAQKTSLASITDLTGQRFSAISNTLQNDKIPAATRAAVQSSIDGQYNQALDMLQNIYGVSLSGTAPAAVPANTVPAGYSLTPAQLAAMQRSGLGLAL